MTSLILAAIIHFSGICEITSHSNIEATAFAATSVALHQSWVTVTLPSMPAGVESHTAAVIFASSISNNGWLPQPLPKIPSLKYVLLGGSESLTIQTSGVASISGPSDLPHFSDNRVTNRRFLYPGEVGYPPPVATIRLSNGVLTGCAVQGSARVDSELTLNTTSPFTISSGTKRLTFPPNAQVTIANLPSWMLLNVQQPATSASHWLAYCAMLTPHCTQQPPQIWPARACQSSLNLQFPMSAMAAMHLHSAANASRWSAHITPRGTVSKNSGFGFECSNNQFP
jgi:hypothetical protein